MSKLRFDPNTYQFYIRFGSGQGMRAKAAGFRWDPLRSRYYTADPRIAKSVADSGDRYVKALLADILGVTIASRSQPSTVTGNGGSLIIRPEGQSRRTRGLDHAA